MVFTLQKLRSFAFSFGSMSYYAVLLSYLLSSNSNVSQWYYPCYSVLSFFSQLLVEFMLTSLMVAATITTFLASIMPCFKGNHWFYISYSWLYSVYSLCGFLSLQPANDCVILYSSTDSQCWLYFYSAS